MTPRFCNYFDIENHNFGTKQQVDFYDWASLCLLQSQIGVLPRIAFDVITLLFSPILFIK